CAELVAGRRCPCMRENMRNTFSTGRSRPLLASWRKPAKDGWASNSKAPGTPPRRVTPLRAASAYFPAQTPAGVLADTVARAMAEARALAGGAPFGIGLADDHGLAGERRAGRDHAKAGVDGLQLFADAHAHVALDELRCALGVKGDEVRGRAGLARGVVPP